MMCVEEKVNECVCKRSDYECDDSSRLECSRLTMSERQQQTRRDDERAYTKRNVSWCERDVCYNTQIANIHTMHSYTERWCVRGVCWKFRKMIRALSAAERAGEQIEALYAAGVALLQLVTMQHCIGENRDVC